MTVHHAYNARHDAARRKAGVCLTKHDLWPIRPHTCAGCGCRLTFAAATLDHIISLANGGTETLANCQLMCAPCNARKGIEERKRAA